MKSDRNVALILRGLNFFFFIDGRQYFHILTRTFLIASKLTILLILLHITDILQTKIIKWW